MLIQLYWRALRIICPLVEYEAALISTGLVSPEARRANLSAKFFVMCFERLQKHSTKSVSLWTQNNGSNCER